MILLPALMLVWFVVVAVLALIFDPYGSEPCATCGTTKQLYSTDPRQDWCPVCDQQLDGKGGEQLYK